MARMYPQWLERAEPVDPQERAARAAERAREEEAARRGAAAERRVYEALDDALPHQVTVISARSVADPGTHHAREIEFDFLLLAAGRPPLALECKAAGARTVARSMDGYVKQLKRNAYGLGRAMQRIPGLPAGLEHGIGVALVLPGAPASAAFTEPHALAGVPELVIGQEHMAGDVELAAAIERAWRWWEGERPELPPVDPARALAVPPPLDPEHIERVIAAIAPTRTGSPLGLMTAAAMSQQTSLTRAQEHALQFAFIQRRAAIVGGAGTGKTLVAQRRAAIAAARGERVLVLCRSRPLAAWLERRFSGVPGTIDVHTFAEHAPQMPRADYASASVAARAGAEASEPAVPRTGGGYDLVIVDEAQDADPDHLEQLDGLLRDPDEGSIVLLWDEHQSLYRANVELPEAFAATFPLERNLRNTRDIHDLADRFRAPGTWGAPSPDGPFVVLRPLAEGESLADAAARITHDAVDLARIPPSKIAILAAADADGFEAAFAGCDELAGHRVSRDAAAWETGDEEVLLTTVRKFRGLECSLAIVTGVGALLDDEPPWREDVLYTALTRGRSWAVIVDTPEALDRFAALASTRRPDRPLAVYRCHCCGLVALSASEERECHRCAALAIAPLTDATLSALAERAAALRADGLALEPLARAIGRPLAVGHLSDLGDAVDLVEGTLGGAPLVARIRRDSLLGSRRLRHGSVVTTAEAHPWLTELFKRGALRVHGRREAGRTEPNIEVSARKGDALGQLPRDLVQELAALTAQAARSNARAAISVLAGPQDHREFLRDAALLMGRGATGAEVTSTSAGWVVVGPMHPRLADRRRLELWIVAPPPGG